MKAAVIPVILTAAALWQAPQRPPLFRSSVETVAVYATVRGSRGEFVSDLRQDDFEIYDNDQRREIVAFSNELQPTTVSILLDRSGSMRDQMAQVTAAAKAFVGKLLPGDRASLSSLQWDCQQLTADRAKLVAALDRGMQFDLGSPIWRALDRVMRSLDVEGGRRAVLIFSDGQDNGFRSLIPSANVAMTPDSCRGADQFADVAPAQVIAHARQEGWLVYAVSVQAPPPPGQRPIDDSDLKRIAKDSGGEAYQLRLDRDLTGAFTAIADELHHQYLIGFVPAVFDNKVHSIDVRIKQPGLTVRARKSYVASQVEPSGPEADARAFAARPSWSAVTPFEVQEAIGLGEGGRRLQASCAAADVFQSRIETRASVRVVAEGPLGRIMRAAGEARRRQEAFKASAITDDMRAPVVALTATLEWAPASGDPPGTKPSPLMALRVHGHGPSPITIDPAGGRPVALEPPSGTFSGLSATFAMTDFKGLPGHDVEVSVSSAAGTRSCRFSRDDVAAIR
jgi:Ca-activated chloride channel family protein